MLWEGQRLVRAEWQREKWIPPSDKAGLTLMLKCMEKGPPCQRFSNSESPGRLLAQSAGSALEFLISRLGWAPRTGLRSKLAGGSHKLQAGEPRAAGWGPSRAAETGAIAKPH